MKKVINIDGKKLHLVFGKSYSEWVKLFYSNEDLWDFLLIELIDGSVEINEDIWYWFINNRCYETNEYVNL